MDQPNIHTLQTFTAQSIPDLDVVVLGALELFIAQTPKKIDIHTYKRPLVVGSGNAEATGRIMFEAVDAVFASESTYESKLKNIEAIDGVIVISASGGKHAPSIVKKAKEFGKPVTLITTTVDSEAKKFLAANEGDLEYVYPKNREPYTYNTSTYLGMILGQTGEDPEHVYQFIREKIDAIDFSVFASYDKYYVIVPTQLSGAVRMISVKFIELFGRIVAYDVETSEYTKHATTVVPSGELFLSFGFDNTLWGDPHNRMNIPLPDNANYGMMIAVAYYVIGKIQKSKEPYFKNNIQDYTTMISQVFGETISPIVE